MQKILLNEDREEKRREEKRRREEMREDHNYLLIVLSYRRRNLSWLFFSFHQQIFFYISATEGIRARTYTAELSKEMSEKEEILDKV